MKVLVLGVTGMLGSSVFRFFDDDNDYEAWGTLRNPRGRVFFPMDCHDRLCTNVDVLDQDALCRVLARVQPNVVVNCVGLIKQLSDAKDPLAALPINSMLPHRLADLCHLAGSRLIHVSTDCVFSGRKGNYVENDRSDAEDLYGKSKFIGEIHDRPDVVTLRTSIVGHELESRYALIEWFLSQHGRIMGYSRAVFSGLPTVELARVMRDHVLTNPSLSGLYHVAAAPISKFDLLRLVAAQYGKTVDIVPDDRMVIDRSLDASRFRAATGYTAPSWPELVALMHANR